MLFLRKAGISMKKKALVTGGLGFIGSHLVDQLLKDSFEVTIIDSLASNVVKPREYSSLCKVVLKPVRDWKPKTKFDEIYHLASPVGPVGVLKYSGKLGYEIVADAQVVAGWAMKMKAKLLFTSTSELYGRAGKFTEDVVKHVPSEVSVRLSYAVGKLLAEIDLLNLSNERGLWVAMIRPFNIAGPCQSAEGGFVLPRFIEQSLAGEPISVYGDGKQIRSLTHVFDVVSGIRKIMTSRKSKGEVFNIGNPKNARSIKELAGIVKRLTESKSKIVFVDPKKLHGKRFAEAFNKVPNMRKMKKFFSWEPAYGLEQVVSDTLEYYKTSAR